MTAFKSAVQPRKQAHSWRGFAAALVAASLVGGCGSVDGVQLNGGVFDLLGVSGDALTARSEEKKLAPRPGLVMPPDLQGLPAPGSEPVTPVSANGASWPVGPEDAKRADQARLEAEHAAFCDKALARKRVDDPDNVHADGPLGPCVGGLGNMLFSRGFRRESGPVAQ